LSKSVDKGWKLGSIDSLLKRICKTGTIVRQPGSGRSRSARIAEDLVLSQEDKLIGINQLVKFRVKLALPVQNVHRKIHRDLQAQMLQTTSCKKALKPIASPFSLADKQPYRLQ